MGLTTPELVYWGVITPLGVVGIGRFAWWLSRGGRARNPLAAAPHGGEFSFFDVGLVVFAYLLVAYALSIAALSLGVRLAGKDGSAEATPGSAAYHQQQVVDLAAKVGAIALMFVLVRRSTSATAAPPQRRWVRHAGLAIWTALALQPLAYLQATAGASLYAILRGTPVPQHTALDALLDSEWGAWGVAQVIFAAIVIAPLSEELFFRGMLLGAVRTATRGVWPAIVISGVTFGMIHYRQPHAVLPLCSMGVILGFLRVHTGTLGPCVAVHALFNATTIAFALAAPEMLRY